MAVNGEKKGMENIIRKPMGYETIIPANGGGITETFAARCANINAAVISCNYSPQEQKSWRRSFTLTPPLIVIVYGGCVLEARTPFRRRCVAWFAAQHSARSLDACNERAVFSLNFHRRLWRDEAKLHPL